jgi:CheY-like chemotaxis protein
VSIVQRRQRECGNLSEIAQVPSDEYGRVLVVDDDALIRDTLATALADEGYSVRVAADGQAALDTLDEWLPDLIVLDLMMPVMDGPAFRAAQRDREVAAHIPVIVLSAAHNIHTRASTLGAAAVFPKPFDLGVLLDTVGRTVREP